MMAITSAAIPMITIGAGLFFFEDSITFIFNVQISSTKFKPFYVGLSVCAFTIFISLKRGCRIFAINPVQPV